jgi:hypothetical protein
MALFSDNPFAGVFRAQKRRDSEAAMAQQQAMAEQGQQAQKAGMESLKAENKFRAENPGVRELQAMSKANSLYVYSGGGADKLFRMVPKTGSYGRTDSTTGKYVPPEMVPVLKPQYIGVGPAGQKGLTGTETTGLKNRKSVYVIPAGVSDKQEYQWMKEEAKSLGIPWTAAPEKYVRGKGTSGRDRREQFYSEVTGRPMGTLMGLGAYDRFGKGAQPQPTQLSQGFGDLSPRQNTALTESTKITEKFGLKTGRPIAHTGFGQIAQAQAAEQTVSPIGEGFGSIGSNLFGAPRYPFAGSRSAFERGAEYTTLGVPRFPFAGY